MKKIYKILILLFIVVAVSVLLISLTKNTSNNNQPADVAVSEESDDVIRIFVKGGYSPDKITAKSGIPLTLKLVTKSTFDCSANVVIKALGVNEYLKATGTFEVKIPPQEKGAVIDGTCGMGMYSFLINFE